MGTATPFEDYQHEVFDERTGEEFDWKLAQMAEKEEMEFMDPLKVGSVSSVEEGWTNPIARARLMARDLRRKEGGLCSLLCL